jgi:hypothetical protein
MPGFADLRESTGHLRRCPYDVVQFLYSKPQGPLKLAMIVSDKVRQLLAIDRYERRALSRRKFAMRSFDANCKRYRNNLK